MSSSHNGTTLCVFRFLNLGLVFQLCKSKTSGGFLFQVELNVSYPDITFLSTSCAAFTLVPPSEVVQDKKMQALHMTKRLACWKTGFAQMECFFFENKKEELEPV